MIGLVIAYRVYFESGWAFAETFADVTFDAFMSDLATDAVLRRAMNSWIETVVADCGKSIRYRRILL